MTSKKTRERIEWLNYAATGLAANGTEMAMSPQDVIVLTESCLAAMDSEPVYQYWCYTHIENSDGDQEEFWFWKDCDKRFYDLFVGEKRMLYRHAQQPVVPDGLIAAVNRLLDSDGSRGCYSAIRCYDAHQEIEKLLAVALSSKAG
ncbi:hypothetical protein AB2523_01550 [Klebsiella michiganensis]|uniref:hypothetical protein n=1 Tax=Klebsiella michiganensis TaxID=1134687 RepID=UPI0034641BFC